MYTNVPHPCGRPGRAGDRPNQRNLSSRTTGLVSFFGSLPFRQLAGPAALFLCWPPRHLAQFPPEVLRAAVDEAHHLGLPVTAHAHAVGAIADAVAAGVDGMEHVSFWTEDGVDAPAGLIRRCSCDQLQAFVPSQARGSGAAIIFLVPQKPELAGQSTAGPTGLAAARCEGERRGGAALPEMAGRDLSVRGTGHRRYEGSRR